jgi:probable Rubsico expression protein CbbX
MDEARSDTPAPEVPPPMATKGLGWSGREGSSGSSDGKPKRPPMGPGAPAREGAEMYGSLEVDERFAEIEDPLAEIPDETPVDAEEALQESHVKETLADLDSELVALYEVKRRVREIASLLVIDRLRRSIGLEADAPTLHMVFTGNPGTGKTTVAAMMGKILYRLGYVRKGHLVSVTRDDLVGQYIGHTAPKTREVIKRAMGGVLFIDEAYSIYRLDNERDYGQEAVEMLLGVMENEREDIVVVMAGYKKQMDRFFSDVPGLSSRIAHHIDFPDYSVDELMDISRLMTTQQRYRFSPDGEEAFRQYIEQRRTQSRFANGRSVRNGLDRMRMRQAIRLYDAADRGRKLTKKDLVTLEAEDILGSRVFEGGAYVDAMP